MTEVDQANLLFSSIYSLVDNRNIWLSDYACSNHMKDDRKLFQFMETSYTSQVRIGDSDRDGDGGVK